MTMIRNIGGAGNSSVGVHGVRATVCRVGAHPGRSAGMGNIIIRPPVIFLISFVDQRQLNRLPTSLNETQLTVEVSLKLLERVGSVIGTQSNSVGLLPYTVNQPFGIDELIGLPTSNLHLLQIK